MEKPPLPSPPLKPFHLRGKQGERPTYFFPKVEIPMLKRGKNTLRDKPLFLGGLGVSKVGLGVGVGVGYAFMVWCGVGGGEGVCVWARSLLPFLSLPHILV